MQGGLDDSVRESLSPTVCTTITLVFAVALLFLHSDLSVAAISTEL